MTVKIKNQEAQKVHAVDRYMAKGLDLIIMVIIALIIQLVWYPIAAVVAIMYMLFHDGMNNGVSPGKKVIGLKVVKITDGSPIIWKDSLLRNLSFGLFTLFAVIPMMGWVLMFLIGIPLLIFEAYLIYSLESGYRLGDILAGTQVVRSNHSRDIEDDPSDGVDE
ncbi:MAG: RDD family protein [Oligoflexia bacterium]|nr:RDD family protein [Oligoflexia bacterium]